MMGGLGCHLLHRERVVLARWGIAVGGLVVGGWWMVMVGDRMSFSWFSW